MIVFQCVRDKFSSRILDMLQLVQQAFIDALTQGVSVVQSTHNECIHQRFPGIRRQRPPDRTYLAQLKETGSTESPRHDLSSWAGCQESRPSSTQMWRTIPCPAAVRSHWCRRLTAAGAFRSKSAGFCRCYNFNFDERAPVSVRTKVIAGLIGIYLHDENKTKCKPN